MQVQRGCLHRAAPWSWARGSPLTPSMAARLGEDFARRRPRWMWCGNTQASLYQTCRGTRTGSAAAHPPRPAATITWPSQLPALSNRLRPQAPSARRSRPFFADQPPPVVPLKPGCARTLTPARPARPPSLVGALRRTMAWCQSGPRPSTTPKPRAGLRSASRAREKDDRQPQPSVGQSGPQFTSSS